MFKKFRFKTPVKNDLPEASGSSPALVVAKKSAPPGQLTDASPPPPGHRSDVSPSPPGHQSDDVSPPVSAASRPSVSPLEAFLDRSAGLKGKTSRNNKKLTQQKKGKQPTRVTVKSHSDSEDEVASTKKIKWLRSYTLTSVLDQVLKAMTKERLPLKSLSFTKDVLDPMIKDQKVQFDIPEGKEGRKKIRDRADRLKVSVLNIVSHYEDTLALPDGLCGDEATEVCAIVVQILELSREYDGNVRSVTTVYKQTSGENLDTHI